MMIMFKYIATISLISIVSLLDNGRVLANRAEKLSNLRGAAFRVYAFEYPPFMYAVKDLKSGNVSSYQGFTAYFTNYLAQHFSLRLEFIPENLEDERKEGQAMANLKTIERKERLIYILYGKHRSLKKTSFQEVDLSTLPSTAYRSNKSLTDLTTVAFQESYILLSPYPEEESRLSTAIRPFNITISIMIVISTLVIGIFMAILITLYHRWRVDFHFLPSEGKQFESFRQILAKSIGYTLSILVQQSSRLESQVKFQLSLRLMLGPWLLVTVILINVYTSTLFSYLTVIKLQSIPTSLEELAANYGHTKCLLTVQKEHPILKMFRNSKYGSHSKIYEWMTRNPQFLTKEYREITDNVVNHGCTHIGTPISSGLRIAKDLKTYGKCRMTASKSLNFDKVQFSFQLQKNSPYTSIAISAGLTEHWKKWSTTLLDLNVCRLNNNRHQRSKVKSIKLIEMSVAFFVLSLGLALATLIFLMEMILRFFKIYYSRKCNFNVLQ